MRRPTVAATSPSEILSRAADLLEAQHPGRIDAFGFWCALGDAADSSERWLPTYMLLIERTEARSVTDWFDDPSRTLPQVLAMLRGQDWRSA